MERSLDFEFSDDDPTILILRGPLDADTVTAVAAAARARRTGISAVEGRDLTFVGAAALSLLIELSRCRPLRVSGPPALRRLITICGLSQRFDVETGDVEPS